MDENNLSDLVVHTIEPVFEYGLYLAGMIVIVWGAANTLYISQVEKEGKSTDEMLAYMRIRLSEAITLGLTFILAAEVIKTFRVPNLSQLFRIVVLVILRQMITYFLDTDIGRLKKEYPDLFR